MGNDFLKDLHDEIVSNIDYDSMDFWTDLYAAKAAAPGQPVSYRQRQELPNDDFLVIEGGVRKFPIRNPADIQRAARSLPRYHGPLSEEDLKQRLIALAHRRGKAYVDA